MPVTVRPNSPDPALHDIPTDLLRLAAKRAADATPETEGPLGIRVIARWRIAAELRRRDEAVHGGAPQ